MVKVVPSSLKKTMLSPVGIINRRRGLYFDCSSDGILINDTVIQGTNGKDFLVDVKETAKRYWGKQQQFFCKYSKKEPIIKAIGTKTPKKEEKIT